MVRRHVARARAGVRGAFKPDFRSRFYQAEFALATDVSEFASLASGGFTPATKTLLWEQTFAASDFEGMTYGPELDNGSWSLLLLPDNASGVSGSRQDLYALTVIPEPGTTGLLTVAALLSAATLLRRGGVKSS